ncbi:MAG: class I SAM-dependent methyltransferase [Chloroflexia bacterium]|nr:class I SAM-dependent methyltransferase [Chloroflexia bacterium]
MAEPGRVGAAPDGPIDLSDHARASSNFRKHTTGNPLQKALIERFHRAIADRVVALAPVSFLDAGCGEGFVAEVLLERLPGLALTGIDFSADAAGIAQAKLAGARFETGDVTALPFPDGAFDVVGCFEVLEHLRGDGAERALAEFARVARRAAVLSVPHEPFFSLANAARGKNLGVRPRGSDPDHVNFWTRRTFAGFVGLHFDVASLGGSFPWTICVATKRGGAG